MVDKVYRMSDCDNIYVKSAGVFLPTLFERKQVIFLIHHLSNLATNIIEFNEKFDHLKGRLYYNRTSLEERDIIKLEFENEVFQFLFATPNMIDQNPDFRNFVHEQIDSGKILIGL